MFTVLAIFLLQNYSSTGEILYIPKEVSLPKAARVVDLKPSVVVTVSSEYVMLDHDIVASFAEVKNSADWVIPNLRDKTRQMLIRVKAEQDAKLQNRLNKVVSKTIGTEESDPEAWKKVTIQADKKIDYLTIKKIMYSIYEAGGGPINFAVAKEAENDPLVQKDQNQ